MAININAVYPPIVESSIPAFLYTSPNIRISFSLPLVANFNNVKNMAIKIVQQSNNKSVVNTEKYYDGIIYMKSSDIITGNEGIYYIDINRNDIIIGGQVGWAENMFYKIQIRFGYNDLSYEDRISFFKWKKVQSSVNGFSEWSNVIITKSIPEPRVDILNNNLFNNMSSSTVILKYSKNVETTRFPEFQGGYYNIAEEPLDKYRFRLYEGFTVDNEHNAYLSTDWQQFNGSGNEKYTALVKQVFNQPLEYLGEKYYTIIFDIITKNKYQCSSAPYTFTITETYLSSLKSLNLIVKDNSNSGFYPALFSPPTNSVFKTYQKLFGLPLTVKFHHANNNDIYYSDTDKPHSDLQVLTLEERLKRVKEFENDVYTDENGCIRIYIKNNPYLIEVEKFDDLTGFNNWEEVVEMQNLDGVYYLSRASEKTNYTIWEDLARFEWYNETAFNDKLTLLYEDFTVENGVKYKYAIQKQSVSGMRSTPKYELNDINISPGHMSNFQACYIYANGIQVKLDLDTKIQQFKRTKLFQKQDSLNSKYPIILRNGLANYAEFSFGGKITLHSDEGTFFKRKDIRDNISSQKYQGGYYYNDSLVISAEKYLNDFIRAFSSNDLGTEIIQTHFKTNSIFNFNHTNENIFMEYIYRKYVEEFLNSGDYKLYKSPTEGNMIVTLTNISLTPNQQLGRLISDFTSTVYEVADNTLSNMKLYNINSLDMMSNNMKLAVGKLQSPYRKVPGQIRGAFDGMYKRSMVIDSGLYKELLEKGYRPQHYFFKVKNEYVTYEKLPVDIINYIFLKKGENTLSSTKNKPYFNEVYDNIIEQIRQQEEIEISDEKKYTLKRISQIWVELYPKYDIEQEIQNLKAITYDTKLNKLKKQIQIAKYELMLKQYDLSQSNIITMILNGKEINMFPGQVYQLDNVDIKTLYLKYTRPVLINYIAEIEETDFLPKVTIGKQELANCGQISGIFTTTEKILNNHLIDRNKEILTISEDYNYSLYQSLDIMDIIKEKTKKKVFEICGITEDMTYDKLETNIDNFLKEENLYLMSYEEQVEKGTQILQTYYPLTTIDKDTNTDVWIDSVGHYIIYHFDGLEGIDIEGDANTEIIFNAKDIYENGEIVLKGDYNKTKIGPTNKFVLKTINRNINELRFAKPSYGIINYRSIVSLEIKGLWQENA